MVEHAQVVSDFRELPPCFRKLKTARARSIGEEIYDILVSLQKLIPEPVRDFTCPAAAIGERRSNYLVAGVMGGWRFPALDLFDTAKVKFVGVAAGALEGARIGAVNDLVKTLFFNRVQQLTSTLAGNGLTALRRRPLNRELIGRVQGISASGIGQTSVESYHGVQLVINRNGNLYTVWTLRVIDVRFHPQLYSFEDLFKK